MNNLLFKLVVMLCLSSLSGCAVSSPEDLRIEKLSLVKVASETKKEIDYGRYVDDDGSFYRLRLELSMSADLIKLSETYHLRPQLYFCGHSDYQVHMSRSELYWNGKGIQGLGLLRKYGREEVPEASISREPDYHVVESVYKKESRQGTEKLVEPDMAGKRNVYAMYLGLYSPEVEGWKESSDGGLQNEYEAYDLAVHPAEVCVVVEGKMQLGGGFKSNLAKIDRGMIEMLLSGLSM